MYSKVILGEKMEKNEMETKILEDEDYVRCPKSANSLTKFLSKNGDGVENATIARLLMISEEKVQEIYEVAAAEIRKGMEEEE
jgi:ERCC4-type nuclease